MQDKREQALAAIREANPRWPEKLVRYAYELMPTPHDIYYAEGTPQRAHAKAYFDHHWAKWAVGIGILPEDAVIPPEPAYNADVLVRRVRNGDNMPQGGTARGAVTKPVVEYVPNPALTLAQRNGVWPPKDGSVGQRIWKMCDTYKAQKGVAPVAQQIAAAAKASNLNEAECVAEFARWCKYVA